MITLDQQFDIIQRVPISLERPNANKQSRSCQDQVCRRLWCMEPPFEQLPGVISVTSGYISGHKTSPTYQEVSSGGTGHAEAVEIV